MKTKTKTETKAGEPARGALCAPSVGRFTRFVFVFVFVFIFVSIYSSSANWLIIRLREQSALLPPSPIITTATATFTIIKDAPLPVGSSLEVPKIVLNTSDKVQAQSSSSSGTLDVALQLLTDVA